MATVDDSTERGPGEQETETEFWHRDVWGMRIVVLYMVLTLVGALAVSRPVVTAVAGAELAASIGIPLYIFGFALLGALTYVFTSVLSNYNTNRTRVFEAGLRIPAALLLAAGVYVLASLLVPDVASATDGTAGRAAIGKETLAAGLAFLVGLYVKLTLRALGAVAESLYDGLGTDHQ
jgi:hypothetical protein